MQTERQPWRRARNPRYGERSELCGCTASHDSGEWSRRLNFTECPLHRSSINDRWNRPANEREGMYAFWGFCGGVLATLFVTFLVLLFKGP
jgi:hypothetical protein